MTTSRWRGTLIYTGSLAAIGTLAVARFGPLVAASDAAPLSAPAVAPSTGASSPANASGSSSRPPSASDASTPAAGSTAASTVTIAGDVAQTRYGPVQVSVTFTGHRIVDVQTLRSPSSQRESARISARSTPALADEVVAAQSATIDTVSGATYTSEGYRESVQSAIDRAG